MKTVKPDIVRQLFRGVHRLASAGNHVNFQILGHQGEPLKQCFWRWTKPWILQSKLLAGTAVISREESNLHSDN
jgi:hypothetical protein